MCAGRNCISAKSVFGPKRYVGQMIADKAYIVEMMCISSSSISMSISSSSCITLAAIAAAIAAALAVGLAAA